jgi:hydrogenase maturation protease
MQKTLIIGYGNAIRGDDAVGHQAACTLLERIDDSRVSVKPVPQLAPEMAHDLAEHDVVIFIDASCEGEPGDIQCRKLEPNLIPLGEMPHALTPPDLLGLTHQLYDAPPRAILTTVCGKIFTFQETLSEPVEEAFPELIQRILHIIENDNGANCA